MRWGEESAGLNQHSAQDDGEGTRASAGCWKSCAVTFVYTQKHSDRAHCPPVSQWFHGLKSTLEKAPLSMCQGRACGAPTACRQWGDCWQASIWTVDNGRRFERTREILWEPCRRGFQIHLPRERAVE